jgi:hypothetical protein
VATSIRGLPSSLRRLRRWCIALTTIALAGCGSDDDSSQADSLISSPATTTVGQPRPPEEEPKQWTLREIARRLTDGGLVVTDSGRSTVRQPFLSAEGHLLKVSGSDLQVFVYADPAARRADSDRLDTARVAPPDAIIDWVAPPHLIASGNLLAIHLTPNERLAERVRLILEAWHADQ